MLVNPLLIPEILLHVSLALPVWTTILPCHSHGSGNNSLRNDDDDDIEADISSHFLFNPKEVISCALVCTTWYSTFYPHLWTVYNGEAVSKNRAIPIPGKLLITQSPNFRFFTNFDGRPINIKADSHDDDSFFKCTQLIDLTLHRNCPRSIQLIRQNPTLKRLCWHGAIPYSGMFADLESEVLATSLSSLETLILSYWDISQGRLIPILRKTAETLKNLVLKHVQGLDHICGSGVPDLVDDNHANAKTGKLELENLRRLAVECEWADNKALLEFITDCCPRLERLDLGETLLENEEMVDQLEQRLKQIRPGLGRDLSDAQRRRMGARFITRDV